jgi:UDP-glucose 4-epimerase
MRILLTGGTGYIGSHTAVALITAGHEVVLADNLSNSKRTVLNRLHRITGAPVAFHEVDVTDEEALDRVIAGARFDAAIHLAAPKAVAESIRRPLHYYHNGVGGTVTLCRVLERHGIRDLVYSSSATVYGLADRLPVTEDSPTAVLNPYGRTKLICEEILSDLSKSDRSWNIVALRYFNPVGAHPSALIGEDPEGVPRNLAPFVAQVAVGRRPLLEIFGDDYPTPDGTAIRDYVHVMDLAEGHVAAVEYLKSHPRYDVINLGTGHGVSVLEMIASFEHACGRRLPTRVVERRPGDSPELWADVSKAADVLGWTARRSLDEMTADVWRWQRTNPEGLPAR